jgi:HAD superfamily hydrolase (TIGR01549 family)
MSNPVVFFDIGGTLLDSPDIFEVITRKLAGRWPDEQTHNLVLRTYESLIDNLRNEDGLYPFQTVGGVHAAALGLLASRHGYIDISGQADTLKVEVYAHQSSFYPETRLVLEKLIQNGVKMIIASDNDCEILAVQKTKYDYDKYFSDYCISETAGAYKPTRGFIRHLQKHLPQDLNQGYFVGDNWMDVESGRRLGIKSVLVDRKNSRGIKADYVIRDLKGLLPILGMYDEESTEFEDRATEPLITYDEMVTRLKKDGKI